jgi:hypothetical protein
MIEKKNKIIIQLMHAEKCIQGKKYIRTTTTASQIIFLKKINDSICSINILFHMSNVNVDFQKKKFFLLFRVC